MFQGKHVYLVVVSVDSEVVLESVYFYAFISETIRDILGNEGNTVTKNIR